MFKNYTGLYSLELIWQEKEEGNQDLSEKMVGKGKSGLLLQI